MSNSNGPGGGERRAGILLHISSLPGDFGIGDLGPEAYYFLDWLEGAGQRCWQMMPLGPPGGGDSPYAARSAFAGNPLFVSPELLAGGGWITADELEEARLGGRGRVDFASVSAGRNRLLRAAFERAELDGHCAALEHFEETHRWWLEDFATFSAARDQFGPSRDLWPEDLRRHDDEALLAFRNRSARDIAFHRFVQWLFFDQWQRLREAAEARGIDLIGDVPIFVDCDSADAWAEPQLFKLDGDGHPYVVAGVPPDVFSETGQHWGNPLYNWAEHERDGFAWWRSRLRHTLGMVHEARLDHFRGFEAAWEIPAESPVAAFGTWVPGPGKALFESAENDGERLALVVDDLGVITPAVRSLREVLGYPGMNVLQFAFDGGSDNPYLPHNHIANSVVYTGTHDTDTTAGWLARLPEGQRNWLRQYLGRELVDLDGIVRTAYQSVARTAIVPMQDVLRLGSEGRMNTPGQAEGQWGWRFSWDELADNRTAWLRDFTHIYGR